MKVGNAFRIFSGFECPGMVPSRDDQSHRPAGEPTTRCGGSYTINDHINFVSFKS